MPIRLVAIDIDGTLLDSRGQLPARNRTAIAATAARGIEVALVTGRGFPFAAPIARQIGAPLTLIASNGAVVKAVDGTTLAAWQLARAVAAAVLAGASSWRDAAGLVFDRAGAGQFVYERLDWSHPNRRAYFERNREFIASAMPLESALSEDPLAVVFNGTMADMAALSAALDALACRDAFAVTRTRYASRDFTLLDVMAAGCSKGSTLKRWAAARAVSPGEVMAIGDNFNDLEMLEFAGLPVVMGNAVDDLKARGWAVTGAHDDAGLAEALERYVLKETG